MFYCPVTVLQLAVLPIITALASVDQISRAFWHGADVSLGIFCTLYRANACESAKK